MTRFASLPVWLKQRLSSGQPLKITRQWISLPLALLATLSLIGINEMGYERSADAVRRIAATQETRATLHKLLALMLDAETGLRGYLLSGDESYLEPYNGAVMEVNQTLDQLRQSDQAHPVDPASLVALSRHVSRKLAEMDLSLKLRKQGKEDAWKFVLHTDVGKEHMDAIREQSAALIEESSHQTELGEQQILRSLLVSRLGIALTALVGLLSFYLYLRQSNALKVAGQREQQTLKLERDRLESLVRDRTASLAKLATYLQQVREDERGHLARELHDELGSLLTAAKLDVARIKSRLGDHAPEALQRLQHLTETLNRGIALKRRIVEDLRPSSLSNLGLLPSLEILTREFSERSDLVLDTQLEAVDLDESSQLTLYRLVQEALTNIGKYARARQASVLLQNTGTHALLTVSDDGIGFNPEQIGAGSHGLEGTRHRVEATGGRLVVESTPGQGSRITAYLPTRASPP
jgi:signal transduction histidine kinase